ncbi:MAG: ribonuclease P protein component [Bacteroidales bacterium]
MTMDLSLSKNERLCSKATIDNLFSNGDSFVQYPFRIVYTNAPGPDDSSVSIMVSVSKKKFKRANKRNLIKRRIKEAYRINKNILLTCLDESGNSLAVAFLYLPKDILESDQIHKKMQESLEQLIKRLK